jgi:hypothetical protein
VKRSFGAHARAVFRTMLISGLVLMAVGTTAVDRSDAAVPVRAAHSVPPTNQGAVPTPAGLLTATDYAIPAGAIHVATDGYDNGAGADGVVHDGSTREKAFRTLRKAISEAEPLDTIVMYNGDYPESVAFDKRITVQAAPNNGRVWMKGSNVHGNWAANSTTNPSFWTATGFTFPETLCRGTCTPAGVVDPGSMAGHAEQVFVNGEPLQQVAWASGSPGVGKFAVGPAPSHQVKIGTSPAGKIVEISTRKEAMFIYGLAHGTIIRGIGFANYASPWTAGTDATVRVDAAMVRLERNAFVRSSGTGLSVANFAGGVLDRNVIAYNGARGANLYRADTMTVVKNRIESNNTENFSLSGCGIHCNLAGMKVVSSDNLTVSDNTINYNLATGLWCDVGCTDTVIDINRVSGNLGSGIFYEVSARATITNNWVTNTVGGIGSTAAGIKIANSEDVTITNNVLVGNHRQLGMYSPARVVDDPYSRSLGLVWKTLRAKVNNNTFVPGTAPNRATELLKTSGSAEVSSRGMFAQATGNDVQEPTTQRFIWWTSGGEQPYTGICPFERATGLDFGTTDCRA